MSALHRVATLRRRGMDLRARQVRNRLLAKPLRLDPAGLHAFEEAVLAHAPVEGPARHLQAIGGRAAVPTGRVEGVEDRLALPLHVLGEAQYLTEHVKQERQAIRDALAATRGNQSAAAAQLGMSRRTFYRRMSEYGLLEGAKPRGIKAQRIRQAGLAGMKGAKKPGEGKALAETSPGPRSKRGA